MIERGAGDSFTQQEALKNDLRNKQAPQKTKAGLEMCPSKVLDLQTQYHEFRLPILKKMGVGMLGCAADPWDLLASWNRHFRKL